ncbi:MAG: maleylpyruvate isomerase N-terminal domain-containing protein, partial [Mycobacterium sp.]
MDRLAIIDSESRRLADVLEGVDPDQRCPTCPEWTASDLLWHLTNVHFFWAGILAQLVQ